jgi:hypothetical protein
MTERRNTSPGRVRNPSQERETPIPFRNCKLAKLLRYHLLGSAFGRTTLVATVSAAIEDTEDTLRVLLSASEAANISIHNGTCDRRGNIKELGAPPGMYTNPLFVKRAGDPSPRAKSIRLDHAEETLRSEVEDNGFLPDSSIMGSVVMHRAMQHLLQENHAVCTGCAQAYRTCIPYFPKDNR